MADAPCVRAANIAALQARLGLDDAAVAAVSDRLLAGTFASARHRYCYIQTPKVACTAIKHALMTLECDGEPPDLRPTPASRETTRTMLVHQRGTSKLGTLLDLPPPAFADAMDHSGSWFSFGVSRNPFTRLLSFYRNKVCLNEPGYGALHRRFGVHLTGGDEAKSFGLFVADLVRDGRPLRNAHLRPQTDLLLTGILPVRTIMRLERLDDDIGPFAAFLGRNLRLAHLNQGLFRGWPNPYDADTAGRVLALYDVDFTTLGYDRDSWRGASCADVPLPMQIRNDLSWVAAICERNEMIDTLYGQIEDSGPDRNSN